MATDKDIIVKDVTCAGGMPAYVAKPSDEGKNASIVLMHERYGLVDHTKDLARRFAHDGYTCIAPDTFFCHPDQDALHRGDDRYDLTDDEAVENLSAAMDALEANEGSDLSRCAVMGVCQTGRHPLILATKRPIAAALVWYGAASKREWEVNDCQPRALAEVIADLDCPVFGSFGEADHIISLDDVRRFRNCLEDNLKSYSINLFRGAPHGWLNDTMPGRYRKEQAETAWATQLEFLAWLFDPARDKSEIEWDFNCGSSSDYDFSKNVRLE
ncbi:MAG: dienelactone hydrolase family protein [Rhodospirillales bacterium]|jgi:carboxymethylenebutenolidase|nr:dienelactone hydrolase family protein [Rhodospirillales bacterium]MBT4007577.1 dienelactone hydrolase family protein [Rhodospirillales bacterium]MBT5076204.1 dienelactone hydrolase family protein [Rhodospirillales bacterium]MBT5113291.1 dienelactone hydrolase family protein [Rhodospirillales bacterium]MBT5671924.1 dienelactone hydrolase family protein [Rhodospirillales bacterium]